MINLVSFENEYNLLLNKYKNEYNNFMSLNSSDLKKIIPLNDKSFWGKTAISDSSVNNQNDCIDLCKKNKNCSGATFVPQTNQCMVRSGFGSINNDPNNVALVSNYVLKLSILLSYNEQLRSIIDKINEIVKNNSLDIDKEIIKKNVEKLKKDSLILASENDKLQNIIYQQNILNSDVLNNSQIVYSNYSVFFIYFSLFLFIIALSLFFIFPNSAPSLILLFIISIILFFS
uniref:Apple domain-containing protein n=1 Tax=viral metagenome TaxID=1070528 RepID=A0A6C0H5F4_9ZZZZ